MPVVTLPCEESISPLSNKYFKTIAVLLKAAIKPIKMERFNSKKSKDKIVNKNTVIIICAPPATSKKRLISSNFVRESPNPRTKRRRITPTSAKT